MIKHPRQSIAELAEQIKKNLIEDSLEFSKKGGHSKRNSYYEKRFISGHSVSPDRTNFRDEDSRFKNMEDVSISLNMEDELERSYIRKMRPASIISPSSMSQKSTAKVFCQNQNQLYNDRNAHQMKYVSKKESIDRSRYLRTICAASNHKPNNNSVDINGINMCKFSRPSRRHMQRRSMSTSSSSSSPEVSLSLKQHIYQHRFKKQARNYEDSDEDPSSCTHDSELSSQKKCFERNVIDCKKTAKIVQCKKARINSIMIALNALQEDMSDSDSSDALSMEYINKMLKKKMKSIQKMKQMAQISQHQIDMEPKYNAYGIIRQIPSKYSRPRLPPLYKFYKQNSSNRLYDLSSMRNAHQQRLNDIIENKTTQVRCQEDYSRSTYKIKNKMDRDESPQDGVSRSSSLIGSARGLLSPNQLSKKISKGNYTKGTIPIYFSKSLLEKPGIQPHKNIVVPNMVELSSKDSNESRFSEESGYSSQNFNTDTIPKDKNDNRYPSSPRLELDSNDSSSLEKMNFAENAAQDSVQKILRQMRITFFKETSKMDENKYEANLPVLPPDINMTTPDGFEVNSKPETNKITITKKRFTDILSDNGSAENLSVIAEEAETCRSSNSLDSRNEINLSEKKLDLSSKSNKSLDMNDNFKNSILKNASVELISEYEEEIVHSEKIIFYEDKVKDLAKGEETEGEEYYERDNIEIVYL